LSTCPQLAPADDDDDDNVLHACRGRLNLLTPWERNFISSVSRQRYPLTVKQRRVLDRLLCKMRPR
jgi:hypothetical protein